MQEGGRGEVLAVSPREGGSSSCGSRRARAATVREKNMITGGGGASRKMRVKRVVIGLLSLCTLDDPRSVFCGGQQEVGRFSIVFFSFV